MSSSDNPLRQLENFGQSIWLDYIPRHLLFSPEFRRLIEEGGLKGMTSNPTIFEKSVAGSGAVLGALYQAGRDKVTFVMSPPIATFGLWLEQLIAQSSGKESTGLILDLGPWPTIDPLPSA
jgi:hypothetical protein